MAFIVPQGIRASRSALREVLATSLPSAAHSSTRTARLAFAPATSFSSRSSSAFSTSVRRWSESTDKAKAAENEAGAEALGSKENAPAGEGDKASAEKDEVAKQLAEKDKLIKELKDQVLYGKAELQNTQRRAAEEKAQAADFGITKFARDLASSLDILDVALKSVPEPLRKAPATSPHESEKVLAELYEGVELTTKSILSMLKTHGVNRFDPTGQKFDPNEHEAMYQAPVPGKEPGTVLECSKVGYKIKDRILRPAQVGVVQA